MSGRLRSTAEIQAVNALSVFCHAVEYPLASLASFLAQECCMLNNKNKIMGLKATAACRKSTRSGALTCFLQSRCYLSDLQPLGMTKHLNRRRE